MKNYIIEDQFPLQVSRGKVKGAFKVTKFGANDNVGTSMETVWDAGGLYPWDEFDSATTVNIISTSTEDDEDQGGGVEGTGAHRITIEGLDNDYNLVSETLITNGTSQRASTTEFKRVYRAYVIKSGTDDTNAGTISIRVGTTTVGQIRVTGGEGLGQTFMSTYTVPAGYTGYIYHWNISTAKAYNLSADSDVYLVQRNGGEQSWRAQDIVHTNANSIERTYTFPLKINEKTDIEVRGLSSTSGIAISATYQILLLKNDTPIPNGTGG